MPRARPQRDAMLRLLLLSFAFLALSIGMLQNLQRTPFPFVQMDEQGHYAYARTLIIEQRWWPDFSKFSMIDSTDQPRSERNYINHPPTFYWLTKILPLPRGEVYRSLTVAIALLTFFFYLRLGYQLALPLAPTALYALLPLLFALYHQAGFFSNDSLAMLGGTVAVMGSVRWLKNAPGAHWLMLLGLAGASVKLTALLLVGVYVAAIAAQHRRRLPWQHLAVIVLSLLVMALPYAWLWHTQGSPAPMTLGQADMLRHNATQWGWMDAPRMHVLPWLATVLQNFTDQYTGPEITAVPVVIVLASLVVLSTQRGDGDPIVARAAATATLGMLVIHLTYSWQRYREFGWLLDTFLRYYFPLLAAYGISSAQTLRQLLERYRHAT